MNPEDYSQLYSTDVFVAVVDNNGYVVPGKIQTYRRDIKKYLIDLGYNEPPEWYTESQIRELPRKLEDGSTVYHIDSNRSGMIEYGYTDSRMGPKYAVAWDDGSKTRINSMLVLPAVGNQRTEPKIALIDTPAFKNTYNLRFALEVLQEERSIIKSRIKADKIRLEELASATKILKRDMEVIK